MKSYKMVLFDLDGTLSDPKVGITKSVQYGLRKMGIDEPDLDKLVPFIGPPLHAMFAQTYGFDQAQTEHAIRFFREYFKDKGMFENTVYPGIADLLKTLRDASKTLVVATSKPTVFSEEILDHFGIRRYFDDVVGSNLDGTRSVKGDIIHHIREQYPDVPAQDFIMIGDREYDIIGAHANGIDSVGVVYGHGSREELTAAKATYVVDTVEELHELLLG